MVLYYPIYKMSEIYHSNEGMISTSIAIYGMIYHSNEKIPGHIIGAWVHIINFLKNEKSKEIIIPHGNHSQDHFFEGKY